MNELLNGKCKQDFKKWLHQESEYKEDEIVRDSMHGTYYDNHICIVNHFDSLPFSMKWGVYQDFFDAKELGTKHTYLYRVSKGINFFFTERNGILDRYKTRNEARAESLKIANQFYNNENK